MKKSFLVIYAAPVALLLMAGGLATPTASANLLQLHASQHG